MFRVNVSVAQEMDREVGGHMSTGMGDAGTERPAQVSEGHMHSHVQVHACLL